ncbi:hypothetical protein [Cloacibacterium caeni]|uniref:hypothetical protein n=1 Tax=Cloacibacterium caeni TaxID=2004710 RepID=UPI001BCED20A|nr:hypothetical protein [Cloacibacterium caeni]
MEVSNHNYITGLKILIQSIPYLGTPLNEFLFEHRGRIKQERLNKFIQNLIDYFETASEFKIENNYITSEEFGDIFESVLEKVTKTDNVEKLVRFRNILKNQIVEPQKVEYIETFIDLIPKISEKQFEILYSHLLYDEKFFKILSKISGIGNFDETEEESENKLNDENEFNYLSSKFLLPESFNLEKTEYDYLIQDLISKSLLLDNGIGRIEIEPLEFVKITSFGKAFIKYVSEN